MLTLTKINDTTRADHMLEVNAINLKRMCNFHHCRTGAVGLQPKQRIPIYKDQAYLAILQYL